MNNGKPINQSINQFIIYLLFLSETEVYVKNAQQKDKSGIASI